MVTDQGVSPLTADPAGVESPALQGLLEAARCASPADRIGFRDPIAAHGLEAITAVAPWLSDRVLAAFAIRVIVYAGADGRQKAAVAVLRKSRPKAPSFVREDIDSAIRQLHPVTRYRA